MDADFVHLTSDGVSRPLFSSLGLEGLVSVSVSFQFGMLQKRYYLRKRD